MEDSEIAGRRLKGPPGRNERRGADERRTLCSEFDYAS